MKCKDCKKHENCKDDDLAWCKIFSEIIRLL